MSRLSISLVMAVLDGARFFEDALASVAAQTRPPDEIVVVDGGSTDGSAEIARRHAGVRVIDQVGDGGFAGAWDEGIAQTRGDAIALLDSDDVWMPEKLELQAAALEADPELDYAVGRVRHVLEPGYPLPDAIRPEILDVDRMAPMPGALLVRRRAYERVGPWATDYTIAADIDWFARAKDLLPPPARIERRVLVKRVHDTNVSVVRAQRLNGEILGLLRESVRRRR